MSHSTAATIAAPRARTGGPSDDEREQFVQQILGWTLTMLIAMIVTGLGLL